MSVRNDLLYLCACAVNQQVPRAERIEKMDLKQLFAFSQSQSLTATVACALESAGVNAPEFQEVLLKSIRKNMLLDYERKKLTTFLNAEKIWHLPLKGILLQNDYPRAGMRQMSDNDILFDETHRETVRSYMLENGYVSMREGDTIVDEYHKAPLYNFEMHITLFHPKDEKLPHFYTYYKDIHKRLLCDENAPYTLSMTHEDYYVYLLAHAYKHYTFSGIGLRTLLDCYVFLKKYESELNWEHIHEACETLGITEYKQQTGALSKQLFSDPEEIAYPKEFEEILQFYATSGTYGTVENRVTNQLQEVTIKNEHTGRKAKLRYLYRRFTLTDATWERICPFAYRHKWARGFVRVYHIISALIFKRKYVRSEMRALMKKK